MKKYIISLLFCFISLFAVACTQQIQDTTSPDVREEGTAASDADAGPAPSKVVSPTSVPTVLPAVATPTPVLTVTPTPTQIIPEYETVEYSYIKNPDHSPVLETTMLIDVKNGYQYTVMPLEEAEQNGMWGIAIDLFDENNTSVMNISLYEFNDCAGTCLEMGRFSHNVLETVMIEGKEGNIVTVFDIPEKYYGKIFEDETVLLDIGLYYNVGIQLKTTKDVWNREKDSIIEMLESAHVVRYEADKRDSSGELPETLEYETIEYSYIEFPGCLPVVETTLSLKVKKEYQYEIIPIEGADISQIWGIYVILRDSKNTLMAITLYDCFTVGGDFLRIPDDLKVIETVTIDGREGNIVFDDYKDYPEDHPSLLHQVKLEMELDHYLGIMFEATEECWNAEKNSIIEMLESAHVSERIIE